MTGGCLDFVAIFNSIDSKSYEKQYGSSFAGTEKNSTKYATKYNNKNNSNPTVNLNIYEVGKTGDATKEVYIGYGSQGFWFSDQTSQPTTEIPFLGRGGSYTASGGTTKMGIFGANFATGAAILADTFRVVLSS